MKKQRIIFTLLVALGALFIYTNLCILYGISKERNSRICLSPQQQQINNDTLGVVSAICVDQYAQIRSEREAELLACQDKLKKTEYSLYKLRSQAVVATTTAVIK